MRLIPALAMFVALPLVGQIQAEFSGSNISISGATKNGSVAVYGVGQAVRDGREVVVTHQSISRATAAGELAVTVEQPAFRSVWIVFDIESGEYTVASPRGYVARQSSVPAGAFAANGKSVAQPRTHLMAFMARRHVGAWVVDTADGAAIDDDHRRDSTTRALLDSFTGIADSPPPPHAFTPNDVVFAIDSAYMDFWVTKVTPKDVAGGNDAAH
jgi:hypothetical protein